MTWQPIRACVFYALMAFSLVAHANDRVTSWVRQVLLSSLSISYLEKAPSDTIHFQYTLAAWRSLTSFLKGYLDRVNKEKLILHPRLQGSAQVVASGIVKESNFFKGVTYWKVTQAVMLPELNITINFSVLVIKTSNSYLIQSMDMSIQPDAI